ncbi:MAG: alpha/beta hydrolase [Pseudomonadales bacterium]
MDLEHVKHQLQAMDFAALPTYGDAIRGYFQFYGIDFTSSFADLTHRFGTFKSGDFDLACHSFQRVGALSTAYVVHGYFDHAGLYKHVIQFLLERNVNVIAFDLPGHGLSTGPRASIGAFEDYVAALDECVKQSAQTTAQPTMFFGQSTGGAVIMQYLLDRRFDHLIAEPKHVVLLAPLVRPAKWSVLRFLFSVNRHLTDSMPRRFSNNSHDLEFLQFLRESDPLQYRGLPMQWLLAMKVWIRHFLSSPGSQLIPLVLQGEQDNTVDWKYNLKKIRSKFPSVKIKFLPDGKHHLANESVEIREQMFALVDDYINTCDESFSA